MLYTESLQGYLPIWEMFFFFFFFFFCSFSECLKSIWVNFSKNFIKNENGLRKRNDQLNSILNLFCKTANAVLIYLLNVLKTLLLS